MNTGQMFLTLGAIMLFGVQLLRVNTSELSAADEVSNAKFSVMGVALARSRIDRAFSLKFDANTVSGNAVPDASGNPSSGSFTAATGLGPSDAEKTSGKADEAKFNETLKRMLDRKPSPHKEASGGNEALTDAGHQTKPGGPPAKQDNPAAQ